jgi:protein subunit release factor B
MQDQQPYQEKTERYPTDRASLERDCDVQFFIASGPGGQHRNKVESGVRLIHRPTGLVVTATERRSQAANREMAFERMAQRIERRQRKKTPRIATRPSLASRTHRLQSKRRTSLNKQLRSSVRPGD